MRAPLDNLWSGFHRTSPQLWPGEIHEHLTASARLLSGAARMLDHLLPNLDVVVGAVNTHAIHSIQHQLVNEFIISRRLGWHGDHYSNRTVSWVWTEQFFGVRVKHSHSVLIAQRSVFLQQFRTLAEKEPAQDSLDRLDIRSDV